MVDPGDPRRVCVCVCVCGGGGGGGGGEGGGGFFVCRTKKFLAGGVIKKT